MNDYDVRRQDAWEARLEQLVAFFAEHGRMPSTTRGDSDEYALGVWLATQRRDERSGTPIFVTMRRAELLNKRLPGWEAPRRKRDDEKWHVTCDVLITFYTERGVWPSTRADDPDEKKLGIWLSHQRAFLRKGTLLPERRAHLDERLPGWEAPTGSRDDKWRATCEAAIAFYTEHGTWPSGRSYDPDARKLGVWLSHQRRLLRKGGLLPERRAYLDKHLPGWATP